MRKFLLTVFLLTLLLTVVLVPQKSLASPRAPAPVSSTAYELIDAVNALRAKRGLAAYQPNSILMQIAQQQADYILSIGTGTHISADGLRPYQRALQAGYAVAGDLSLGGWFSENIVAGIGMTAEQAVDEWAVMDELHLNTMISPNLQEIGAGVAVSGNTYYYLIDCGLSTGGTPVPFTPPPTYKTAVATMIPNTPNADGSVTYTVQENDTLLGIAISYNISLTDLYALNGLTEKSYIYPGDVLIISPAFTATPTLPTGTPTEHPTITPWPTSTSTTTWTPIPPTATPSAGLAVSSAGTAVGIIIGAALVVSLVVALLGKKKG